MAIVKILPQLGCVSQDSDASVSQRGKQSRGNPMQIFLGPIRRIRFTQSTLRQASIREKKGPSLEKKYKSNFLISEVPTLLNLRTEETERLERCARGKAWNLARNIHKLNEKGKATLYSPAEEWMLPAASTKEREESEFVVDSGAKICTWSARVTLTLLSWRP